MMDNGHPPDDLAARLGVRLRALRTDHHRTLASVAADAGMSVSHLSSVEKGLNLPSLPALARIAEALHVTLGDLMREEGQNHVTQSALPTEPGRIDASHDHLVLGVVLEDAAAGSTGACPVSVVGREVFAFVRTGTLTITLDDTEAFELHAGDAVDIRQPRSLTWEAGPAGATTVWSSAPAKAP